MSNELTFIELTAYFLILLMTNELTFVELTARFSLTERLYDTTLTLTS